MVIPDNPVRYQLNQQGTWKRADALVTFKTSVRYKAQHFDERSYVPENFKFGSMASMGDNKKKQILNLLSRPPLLFWL